MRDEIVAIIEKVTKIDADTLMKVSNEPRQWDSMNHIEIILLLEETFDIRFDTESIAKMDSVDAICRIVEWMV